MRRPGASRGGPAGSRSVEAPRPRLRRLRGLPGLLAVPLVGAVLACVPVEQAPDGLGIANRTDGRVDVVYLGEWSADQTEVVPGRIEVLSMEPGGSSGTSSLPAELECTVFDLVAYDADGEEIERLPPPVCLDEDPSWIIDGEPDT